MVPMGTFKFVTLNLRDPLMNIWEIVGSYDEEVVITNAFIGFGGMIFFFVGAKMAILGKIFDKILSWWLTIPQWKEV